MRVVLTGGASGGHVIPLEPIVDALRTIHAEQKDGLPAWLEGKKLEIYFLGIVDDTARQFLQQIDVKVVPIPSGKLRRYASAQTFVDVFFRLPFGVLIALFRMWRIMPDVVISKGGYGSVPIVLASVFYRVPFLLHESDAVSGLANRLMASWATVISVGFSQTREALRYYRTKTIVTGTPVRSSLSGHDMVRSKSTFGFAHDLPVLLIMGGSQGAQQINDVLLEALPVLLPEMGVIHVTGSAHLAYVKKSATALLAQSEFRSRYKVFDYLQDMLPTALAAADVVVTRAGATSLAEMARLRKPTIVVPLDLAAQDHQRKNAEIFVTAHAARVIDPANLGKTLFLQNVQQLIREPQIRETLQRNIAQLDRPRASRDIGLLAFKLAQGLVPHQAPVEANPVT